jgi:hypothetical protein
MLETPWIGLTRFFSNGWAVVRTGCGQIGQELRTTNAVCCMPPAGSFIAPAVPN